MSLYRNANFKKATITHPEIRRYFMTTREAASLVLQGYTIGEHGDILVLDMGEPISILELARTLIRLSGTKEQHEGEKLYEGLFSAAEEVSVTSWPKIKRARGKPMAWPTLLRHLRELRTSISLEGAAPVRAKLQEIAPEYSVKVNGHHANQGSPRPELCRQVAGRI